MSRARSVQTLLIAVLLGVNLLALVASAYWLYQSKHQFVESAEIRTRNIASAVERNLSSSVDKVDFALMHMVDDVQRLTSSSKSIDSSNLNAAFSNMHKRLPEIEGLRVADKDGHVFLGSGMDLSKPVSIADRDYYQALRAGQDHTLWISKPMMGRLVKHPIIVFARRYDDAQGQFAGVVFATIALDYFQHLLARFDLGAQGTLVLRDLDLGLIVRSPPIADLPVGQVGNRAVSAEFRTLYDSGSASAIFFTPQGSDSVERIIAFEHVSNAPMLIIAGSASADYLSGWYGERDKTIASTGLFMLVTLVLGAMLWRLLNTTALEALRNQVYLRNASDGIQITDASGQLLEANDRLCSLLGYSRSELQSMGAQLWPQCWPDAQARDSLREQAQGSGEPQSLETTLRRKDGSLLDVEVRSSHFYWSDRLHLHASIRDIGERKAHAEKIELLAFFDPLTRLPNRRLMLERLNRALLGCARHPSHCALLLIDIDNFKVLNDTLGHAVGDQLLVEMARRLQTCLRQGDTAARMGGDEFVVILEGLDGGGMAASQAEAVAEKIMAHLRQPFLLDLAAGAQDLPLRNHLCTSSIGIAMFNDQSLSTDELLMRSDTAMYQAKASGRNTVRFFDPDMQSSVDARAALEHDLRHALEQDQLQLYYQPQVDDQDRIMGAEVLLRWLHPERGLVMPGHFIPLAEETGVILALGAWVLENACAQLTRWAQQSAFSHLTISVNVSARQFRQSDFVQQVQTIVQASGANPRLLKLELTESLMVNSVQETVGKMEALHDYGIAFSLDDFGTGYSSLSYLQRLPLDQLKIDQSFVRDLLQDSKDAAIAQTVVNLAQNLGLSVIAEGVETQAQRDFLSDIGCHAYQGYLFGRPCPLQEFEQLFSVAA